MCSSDLLTEIENAVINGYVVEDAIAVLKKNDSNAQLFLFYVDMITMQATMTKMQERAGILRR